MQSDQPIEVQQSFWNDWNAQAREHHLGAVSIEQAQVISRWMTAVGRRDLNIIDVGCGTGWLCAQLSAFGQVTGTDLSNEVLERAAIRHPAVTFVAGDFMNLELPTGSFDVVVSLEVLSHVADQKAFLARLHSLLRPDGTLMIATQNRPALERNDIPPPKPGQLRRWVDKDELHALLSVDFTVLELCSITPQFNRGLLRLLNSRTFKGALTRLGLQKTLQSIRQVQEHRWLGWTLMALARKAD